MNGMTITTIFYLILKIDNMNKYIVTYWAERNDESTDIEVVIEANDEIEAMQKFFEMNIIYRKIESITLK
jgi:hypothetical protein